MLLPFISSFRWPCMGWGVTVKCTRMWCRCSQDVLRDWQKGWVDQQVLQIASIFDGGAANTGQVAGNCAKVQQNSRRSDWPRAELVKQTNDLSCCKRNCGGYSKERRSLIQKEVNINCRKQLNDFEKYLLHINDLNHGKVQKSNYYRKRNSVTICFNFH